MIVMAPRDGPAPRLEGELRSATLVRTPVMRVAANNGSDEAFLGNWAPATVWWPWVVEDPMTMLCVRRSSTDA